MMKVLESRRVVRGLVHADDLVGVGAEAHALPQLGRVVRLDHVVMSSTSALSV